MMSSDEKEEEENGDNQRLHNDLYFHSTQMQSIHEETLAEESHADVTRKSISRLSSFKHEDTNTESVVSIQKPIRKITTNNTSKRKLKAAKPRRTRETVKIRLNH